jgi:two-component system, cell cycle response regulator
MSSSAARIAQEALRADATVEKLADLAVADAAFALQLLALVNSAAFGRSQKVTDIRQAATLLGIRGVRTVALSLLVSGMCPNDRHGRVLMANSLRRAAACRLIATELGYKDADGAFATGLFLDSGLLTHAQADAPLAAEIAGSPAHHRLLRERVAGLRPHPESGAELAESMALPPATVEAIREHHAAAMPTAPLAAIAWLAEAVASVFESPEVDSARDLCVARAAQLKLKQSQIDSILDNVPVLVGDLAQNMQRDVGEMKDVEALRADAHRLLSQINQEYEGVIRHLGELLNEKDRLAQELRVANNTLAALATTDGLTGLSNRRALEQALQVRGSQAAKAGAWLSVVAFDVDHFKRLNDNHGHAAGDAALTELGRILREIARPHDTAARYGGEEFTLVLPATPLDQAQQMAEKVRARLESTPICYDGEAIPLTLSAGVAGALGGAALDTTTLLACADKALYRAKQSGRNRVVCSGGDSAEESPTVSSPARAAGR